VQQYCQQIIQWIELYVDRSSQRMIQTNGKMLIVDQPSQKSGASIPKGTSPVVVGRRDLQPEF